MYCTACGAQMDDAAKFCSKCGQTVGGPPLMPVKSRLAGHIRLLGIFWLAISAFRLIPGVVLVTLFGWQNRVFGPGTFPPGAPAFVAPFVSLIGWIFVCSAAAGFAAGWGLLSRQAWARMLTIILGALALIDIPFGTVLGIYTLWVLLPAEAEEEYERQVAQADAHPSPSRH
jgi:zinc-ribbon domain